MDNKPLVSVIIPTYKRSNLIVNSIESVLNQTYKNLEIIVIDDNDSNCKFRQETRNILENYIKQEKIIYIANEKNLGGAVTRNKGAKIAKGEYIAFLDDDDTFFPDKLKKQVELIESIEDEKVGLIYCQCNGIDINGNVLWSNINSYEDLPLYESMIYCIASTSLWLCDKKIFLELGGFEDMPSKQDLLLMVKFIAHGYKIKCVKEILVNYLEHNYEKISTNKPKIHIADGYEILRSYCRLHYNELTKRQVNDVEYRFSRVLCLQYAGLAKKNKSFIELFNMIKRKQFSISNIKMLIRIINTKR